MLSCNLINKDFTRPDKVHHYYLRTGAGFWSMNCWYILCTFSRNKTNSNLKFNVHSGIEIECILWLLWGECVSVAPVFQRLLIVSCHVREVNACTWGIVVEQCLS